MLDFNGWTALTNMGILLCPTGDKIEKLILEGIRIELNSGGASKHEDKQQSFYGT